MGVNMIKKITDQYTRRYSDNGQITTYIEWVDIAGNKGRTEFDSNHHGEHAKALMRRADREGVPMRFEVW
jgi:glycyl-tRNA synthetase (class II)